jgi:hypothetical protein
MLIFTDFKWQPYHRKKIQKEVRLSLTDQFRSVANIVFYHVLIHNFISCRFVLSWEIYMCRVLRQPSLYFLEAVSVGVSAIIYSPSHIHSPLLLPSAHNLQC